MIVVFTLDQPLEGSEWPNQSLFQFLFVYLFCFTFLAMPYGMWPPAFRQWGDEEEPAEETKGKALEVGGGQRESLHIFDLYKEPYANFFFFLG